MTHMGSDGRNLEARAEDAGYTGWTALGENVAGGASTPAQVVQGWLNSDGHCSNLMQPDFTDLGVGYVYMDDTTYRHHWVQNFGRQ